MSEMRDKQNNAAVPSNMQQDGTRIEVEADKPISTTRMQQLVDALNTYSNAYYFGSEPLISDAEFDALMEEHRAALESRQSQNNSGIAGF